MCVVCVVGVGVVWLSSLTEHHGAGHGWRAGRLRRRACRSRWSERKWRQCGCVRVCCVAMLLMSGVARVWPLLHLCEFDACEHSSSQSHVILPCTWVALFVLKAWHLYDCVFVDTDVIGVFQCMFQLVLLMLLRHEFLSSSVVHIEFQLVKCMTKVLNHIFSMCTMFAWHVCVFHSLIHVIVLVELYCIDPPFPPYCHSVCNVSRVVEIWLYFSFLQSQSQVWWVQDSLWICFNRFNKFQSNIIPISYSSFVNGKTWQKNLSEEVKCRLTHRETQDPKFTHMHTRNFV